MRLYIHISWEDNRAGKSKNRRTESKDKLTKQENSRIVRDSLYLLEQPSDSLWNIRKHLAGIS